MPRVSPCCVQVSRYSGSSSSQPGHFESLVPHPSPAASLSSFSNPSLSSSTFPCLCSDPSSCPFPPPHPCPPPRSLSAIPYPPSQSPVPYRPPSSCAEPCPFLSPVLIAARFPSIKTSLLFSPLHSASMTRPPVKKSSREFSLLDIASPSSPAALPSLPSSAVLPPCRVCAQRASCYPRTKRREKITPIVGSWMIPSKQLQFSPSRSSLDCTCRVLLALTGSLIPAPSRSRAGGKGAPRESELPGGGFRMSYGRFLRDRIYF